MTAELTSQQQRLCDILQEGLPVCSRPFAAIAETLGVSEVSVLIQTVNLRRMGIIRRIGPVFDYRALGRVGVLVTAHVEEDAIDKVAEAVNSLAGVSHNYLRGHHYNLWFTLQAGSEAAIEEILAKLSADVNVAFHSLPAVRTFKLDARFGLSRSKKGLDTVFTGKTPVVLSETDKAVLCSLQKGLEIVTSPFAEAEDDDRTVVETVKSLVARGVIKRIAATVDYRLLGFTANAMFCCKVAPEKVDECGKSLAAMDMVSHCYERRTFPGWPYNLFGMMHSRSDGELNEAVGRFLRETGVKEHALLPTLKEFKKKPVRQTFSA
jgi:DNA-binding Lrp family transcriptional regulator